jgi:hypothetical protein
MAKKYREKAQVFTSFIRANSCLFVVSLFAELFEPIDVDTEGLEIVLQ